MRGTTMNKRGDYSIASGEARRALGDGTIVLKQRRCADGTLLVKTGATDHGSIESGRVNMPVVHVIRNGQVVKSYSL